LIAVVGQVEGRRDAHDLTMRHLNDTFCSGCWTQTANIFCTGSAHFGYMRVFDKKQSQGFDRRLPPKEFRPLRRWDDQGPVYAARLCFEVV
jgi:hypothetical protein